MNKEDNSDWDEFTQDLDDSLKSVSNKIYLSSEQKEDGLINEINKLIQEQEESDKLEIFKKRHENYNYQKNISYKNNEYYDNYFRCKSCGEVYDKQIKFCTECGSSKTKEYRNNRICNECKITFNGKYCPECGHGEIWDALQIKPPRGESG